MASVQGRLPPSPLKDLVAFNLPPRLAKMLPLPRFSVEHLLEGLNGVDAPASVFCFTKFAL